ncbi:hypothetical protein NGUA10_04487 [Salmonella enterica]|nr:hypothetical protein NGUA10_04487 [Salmonella enterica]
MQRIGERILVRKGKHGAVRQGARRAVDHNFALSQQLIIEGKLGKSPGQIMNGPETQIIHIIVITLLLLEMVRTHQRSFPPHHLVSRGCHR